MTDRELLEAAAKAAEMSEPDGFHPIAGFVWVKRVNGFRDETRWNPLRDDGDALRLAVKLNLRLVFHPALNQALVRPYHSDSKETESYENGEDHANPYAATRRAIVRAAAAMAAQGVLGAA